MIPGFQRRSSLVAAAVMLVGSAVLLFARLGHYALWDDEAITAMTARAVWQTGDTSVRVDDHNLLAYRNGLLVRNFKDRFTPPLQFYVFAPFIGWLGDSNFICRLPSALCGLFTVCIFLLWLRKAKPPPLVWWAAVVILLTNAEFFLFARQCRYYGLAMMLSAAAAYLYCTRDGSVRRTLGLSLGLAALLTCQYLDYAAVVACLVVDYAIWGRRQPLRFRQWMLILLPQLIVGAVVCSIWNPLARQAGQLPYHSPRMVSDRLHLLWWNWRDMVACDFAIIPLLIACPLLYWRCKSNWLLRAPLALLIFVSTIAMIVPTAVASAHSAEVRYLAPALPLCIGIATIAVYGLLFVSHLARASVLVVAAVSLFIKPSDEAVLHFEPTAWLYYHELAVPEQESYTPVIDWINQNVPAGASIFVQPGYKAYPLMLRASRAVYAWQLDDPPRRDFQDLPPIHFFGREAPDYLIRFGNQYESRTMNKAMDLLAKRGIEYDLVETIPLHWKDWYRPELIWRSFITVPAKAGEEIYIYRRRA